MNEDSPFDNIDLTAVEKKAPPSAKKGKDKFNRAAEGVSRQETQKATGDNAGMHGSYKQANFKLKPEVIDQIDEWAVALNCNKSQLKRYLTWRGLQALQAGERPDYSSSNQLDLADY